MEMAQNNLLLVLMIQLMFLSCEAKPESTMYAATLTLQTKDFFFDVSSVNKSTGNSTVLCSLGAFYMSFEMVDGIAAMDSKNGIFYVVTDFPPNPLIYSADVINRVALPPFQPNVYRFNKMVVRPATGELFVILTTKTSPYEMSLWALNFPVGNVRIMNLPQPYVEFESATFDDNDTLIIVAASNKSSDILFIDPNTGDLEYQLPFLNCSNVFMVKLFFDPSDKMLYGGAWHLNGKPINYWVKVDPNTGECTETEIKGTAADWAYDPNTRNIWYTTALENDFLLVAVNVDTNEMSEVVTNDDIGTFVIDPTGNK